MNQQIEAKCKKAKTFQKYIEISLKARGDERNQIPRNQALLEMIEAVNRDKMLEKMPEEMQSSFSKSVDIEGMKILLIGEICQAGMDYLARYYEGELTQRFAKSFIALGRLDHYAHKNQQISTDVSCVLENKPVISVGEGGMYRALNDLAVLVDSGFVVDYHKVPISQVAIEFCEFFDMDPWRLFSGNSCFLVLDIDGKTGRKLKHLGVNVSTIGRLQKDKKKVIRHSETESLLNRAKPDDLLELMKK